MNNQILDDLDLLNTKKVTPSIANWKFRVVGLFRFFLSSIIFFMFYANIMDWYAPRQAGEHINQVESFDIPLIIFSLVIVGLFLFPLIYHIRQGWAELLLKDNIFKKRPFRGVAMFFTGFIIVVIIISSIASLAELSSMTTAVQIGYSIGSLFGIGLILIIPASVFWMDRQYKKYDKANHY